MAAPPVPMQPFTAPVKRRGQEEAKRGPGAEETRKKPGRGRKVPGRGQEEARARKDSRKRGTKRGSKEAKKEAKKTSGRGQELHCIYNMPTIS